MIFPIYHRGECEMAKDKNGIVFIECDMVEVEDYCGFEEGMNCE